MGNSFDLANQLVLRLVEVVYQGHADSSLSEPQSVEALDALLVKARSLTRELLNQHHPLHRLPSEIMTYIFSLVPADVYCAENYPVAWTPRSAAGRAADILPLTAVCRHWRSISLKTPLLWSTIEDYEDQPNPRPCFTNFIHRCPRGPLYVHIHGVISEEAVAVFAESGERIRDLCLYYISSLPKIFDGMLTFKTDNLRRCSLGLDWLNREWRPPSHILFQGHAPQLRSLRLERFSWLPSNQFPSLVHLILQCSWQVSITFHELQTFLSASPGLESLHLGMLAGSGIEVAQDVPLRPSLSFPKLRKFSIVDDLRYQMGPAYVDIDDDMDASTLAFLEDRPAMHRLLLSTIALPAQCLVYLRPVLSQHLSAYADRISRIPINPTSMRMVYASEFYSARGTTIPTAIAFQLVDPARSRGACVDVQVRGCNSDQNTIQENIQRTIATSQLFANVRELWADTGTLGFLHSPSSVLRALPRLRFLQLWCSIVEDDTCILPNALETLAAVEGESVACCELETLCVLIPDATMLPRVRYVVLRRADMGFPLNRLHLVLDKSLEDEGEAGISRWSPTALEDARRLGDLVEHFGVTETHDSTERASFAPDDWMPSWKDRVPPECRAAERVFVFWPVWEGLPRVGD